MSGIFQGEKGDKGSKGDAGMKGAKGDAAGKSAPCNCKLQVRYSFDDFTRFVYTLLDKKVKVMESNSRNQKIYYICELSKIADSKRKAEEEIINTKCKNESVHVRCLFP